ncbi:MAG: DUF1553 domain-containing protein, partial [Opitutus sp.]|nr:DUF1553 domain-containing protein [Opitutus sp.]
DEIKFNRDIRPILSETCFQCHGPDANARKAKLRLDRREEALRPAKSGEIPIIPGKPEESEIIRRLFATDEDDVMPPPAAHKTISRAQKELIKRWVTQGARYETHWAFTPPTRAALPALRQKSWPRNPVDHFILARLETEKLSPSPEADRFTLIRRVSLDLTGLPPSPAEVDAFIADRSPNAYEKVVDRLLASPHFGERMAVDWLDAARFADSNGYQVDRDREMWAWRDWVIRAFNDNQRFDQFTIEQLAGDLLPNPTFEQRIATGFHRNHMMNEETGIIPEEFVAEYTADRVETTAAVWLGQTFNCTRCHDHKFDPFTQRDFYALKAFFHNIPELGEGTFSATIRQNNPPWLKLPAPEIEAKLSGLNSRMTAVSDQLAALPAGESSLSLEKWAQRVAATLVPWEPVELLTASGGDQPPEIDRPARTVDIGPQGTRANTITLRIRLPAGRVTALQLESATTASAASFQWSGLKLIGSAKEGMKSRTLELRAIAAGDSLAPTEAAKVLDDDRSTRANLALKPESPIAAVFELEPALVIDGGPSELQIELAVENAGGPSRWRVLITATEADILAPSKVVDIARKEPAQRTAAEHEQLTVFRRSQQPAHRALSDRQNALKKQIAAAEAEIPTALVMEEMKSPRPTFVLMRGAYDKPGERVEAATPAALPALAADQPRNRLGLARWLVDPANPLTARVTVNRFWQSVFGTGLVRTAEDFGSQGELPSHPELLDWLATEFVRTGWDVKAMLRLLVTSATYRQTSKRTPTLRSAGQQSDPANRLLARAPRFRLQAEFVRDQALAASGLLARKIGGVSVKPYHPPGLYEQVTSRNSYHVYVAGKGEDLHRRSLYTYWKRSVPNPAMLLFDAPFREACTVRRSRTNTPLQALNLMNDPTYVEAARFLAQRMLLEGGGTTKSKLTHGFRLLLVRPPQPAELALLLAAGERARADFADDREAAAAFLAVGDTSSDATLDSVELAAFTTVASTLLNLDAVIMKE